MDRGRPRGSRDHARPENLRDGEARAAIRELDGAIDGTAATAVWNAALASTWREDPVWFHGDLSPGNLLLRDGRLRAVIDFGTCGVGDPACDLAIAFTTFTGESRAAFRAAVDLDEATWARGRGWAMWKALVVATGAAGTHSPERQALEAHRVIAAVIDDSLGR
jgi:aminoglycoside phosphotransferase (APT) family kinase protein